MGNERRQHQRYDTEVKISFTCPYDLETKLDYQVVNKIKESKMYHGLTRNVSAAGLCFVSNHQLADGLILKMEVYPPGKDIPVVMTGEVRWCQQFDDDKAQYTTGVKVIEVDGKKIDDTVYFDETYQIYWSSVLQSVFDNFKNFSNEVLRKYVKDQKG